MSVKVVGWDIDKLGRRQYEDIALPVSNSITTLIFYPFFVISPVGLNHDPLPLNRLRSLPPPSSPASFATSP